MLTAAGFLGAAAAGLVFAGALLGFFAVFSPVDLVFRVVRDLVVFGAVLALAADFLVRVVFFTGR